MFEWSAPDGLGDLAPLVAEAQHHGRSDWGMEAVLMTFHLSYVGLPGCIWSVAAETLTCLHGLRMEMYELVRQGGGVRN